MTVKELSVILSSVDNKDRKVCMEAYSVSDVNGYYYSKRDGVDSIVFTTLYVQPLIADKNEVQKG